MARNKSDIFKNTAEIFAADAPILPLLVAANISTINVDGKAVPAAEAPLNLQIAALGAVKATGSTTQDSAQLIEANGQLAAQKDKLAKQLTQRPRQ